MKPILITIHGGCFVGGDSSWDKEQTELLRTLDLSVHQIDLVKDKGLEVCLESIRKYVRALPESAPKYVLGRSSGGYLAKVLFDEGVFEKAIYLAPVFNPLLRGELVPHLGEKARDFFKDQRVPDTDRFDGMRELLFLAGSDENVPTRCFTETQLREAKYLGINTHAGLLKTTSEKFLSLVKSHLEAGSAPAPASKRHRKE
jgi:hypothetical protein